MKLLTVDEARSKFGRSAIALVEAVAGRPDRLPALLLGRGTLRGLDAGERQVAQAHRKVIREVQAAGHAEILDDQVEGALGYAAWFNESALAA